MGPPGPQTADGRRPTSGASKGASDTDAVWSRRLTESVAGDPGTLAPPSASQCGLPCCNTRLMRCLCGWASRHAALCRTRGLCQRPVRCPTHMRIVLKINVMRRRSPGLATSVGPPQPERSRGRPLDPGPETPAVPLPLPLLALFHGRLGDSRLAELEAVAQRLGAPGVDWTWDAQTLTTHGGDVGPSVVQPLPSLGASHHAWLGNAAARSVACRGVFEVWGAGDTIDTCAAQTATVPAAHIRARVHSRWRLDSVVLGARRSQHPGDLGSRLRAFGHVLDALDDRPVDLSAPVFRLWLVEDRRTLLDDGPLPAHSPTYHLLFQLPTQQPPIQDTVHRLISASERS